MARPLVIHRAPPPALALALGAAALLFALAACTSPAPPSPTTPAPTASHTPTATPTPSGPVLMLEGSAQENLPLFTQVVAGVWAGPEPLAGRAYVDALTAAGFDKAAMQVTADQSTVGNPAESIQFSVRWGEDCLVGQVGPATGQPVTIVVPGLADGGCLVGTTRAIDW